MQRLGTIFAAITFAISSGMCTASGSTADIPNSDKLAAATAAEQSADLARAHNDFETALYNYKKAVRLTPQNSNLWNKLGVAELKLGNRGAARKDFGKAVKCDPHNAVALNNLGAVALIEKKYKPAVRYLKQALALDELNATAHLNLAEAWMGLEDVDRAMTEFARAIELDADILTSGQSGIVAQYSTPEQRSRADFLIARAYAKRGNLESALEYLRRAKAGRFPYLARVYTDQEFAILWQDPRLSKIVKR
ncbi:MAG TPA: tetratricopeptide repeat protein [Terracidiphilus sp.]|nr:tetratricopeptide repeat protein [Terracidiphilus sp.]